MSVTGQMVDSNGFTSTTRHINEILDEQRRYEEETKNAVCQKWKLPPCGQPVSLFSNSESNNPGNVGVASNKMRPQDDST